MGKFKLPDKNEFAKIVEDAFSSEEIHSFSSEYKQKKDNIQRGTIMKKSNNRAERAFVGVVAAAVMAVVAIPTGVVLSNRKTVNGTTPGTDENEVIVEATENPDPMAGIEDVTEIPEITEDPKKYDFGWLPEDMSFDDDGAYAGKIHRYSDGAGITPRLFKNIGDRDLIPIAIYEFPTKDEYDLEGRHVTIFYASEFRESKPNTFGRNVWITFEGSQYAVFLYVSDNVEDDILEKIIENISLVPTDEDYANDYEKEYNESIKAREKVAELDKENETDITETPAENDVQDEFNCIKIGETYTDIFDYHQDYKTVMDITLTDAYLTDSFDGITTDGIGWDADFSEFADENGKILDCYTVWYENDKQPDDGSNKIIDTETVGSKILIVNMTLTNQSDARDDYNILSYLRTVHDGKIYAVNGAYRYRKYSDCSYSCNMDGLRYGGQFSLSVNGTKGDKNSVILEPGESADIRLAYFLPESDVDSPLYLDLTTIDLGTGHDSLDGHTLVDISGVKER